jgi:YVTN family beta-propeller protein
VLAAVLLGTALPGRATAAEPPGTLVVANRTGGSVSLIDLETEVEIARLPIGPQIPHEVAVSPDGRWAVTGEYGGNDNPGRRIVVIDVVNARIAGYVDLGPVSRPHSFAFLPDGRRVVATMEQADRIALVDIERFAVLETFPTGGREGHMVRLSPDGAEAYVTSRGAEGTLSIVSLREDVPPVVVPTGEGAEGLAVTPDGTEVWVVNRAAGSISVVNTGTAAVVATLPARAGAGRAEITAAGRVLVPNGAAGTSTEKYLTVYDLASRRVVDERRMGEGGGAYGILVVGERAFVADRAERSILAADLTDLSSIRTLEDEHPDPDGMAYSPLRVAAIEEAAQ